MPRVNKGNILDNENRKLIYDAMDSLGYASFDDIASIPNLTINRKSIKRHLEKLQEFDYVIEEEMNGKTVYRTPKTPRKDLKKLKVSFSDLKSDVLGEISKNPDSTIFDISDNVNLGHTMTSIHIAGLKDLGLVEEKREKRKKKYRPTSDGLEAYERITKLQNKLE